MMDIAKTLQIDDICEWTLVVRIKYHGILKETTSHFTQNLDVIKESFGNINQESTSLERTSSMA